MWDKIDVWHLSLKAQWGKKSQSRRRGAYTCIKIWRQVHAICTCRGAGGPGWANQGAGNYFSVSAGAPGDCCGVPRLSGRLSGLWGSEKTEGAESNGVCETSRSTPTGKYYERRWPPPALPTRRFLRRGQRTDEKNFPLPKPSPDTPLHPAQTH
jgi:hypothetical protein